MRTSIWISLLTAQLFGGELPRWVSETPGGYAFDYAMGASGWSASVAEAKGYAETMASQSLAQQRGTLAISSHVRVQRSGSIGNDGGATLDAKAQARVDWVTLRNVATVATEIQTGPQGYMAFALVRAPALKPRLSPSAWGCVWRSALLPGWGHAHHGGRAWSWTLPWMLGVASAGAGFYVAESYRHEKELSRSQQIRDWASRQEFGFRVLGWSGIGLAALTWSWAMADVSVLSFRDPEGLTHFDVRVQW